MVDFTDDPKFIGLDDDAFGDGETDETTQPLSVYKERRIDGNNRAILGVNDQVSYTPRVNPSGNFHSTLSKTGIYIYFAPVIISGSTQKVRLILRGSMVIDSDFRNPLAYIQFELFERTSAIGARKFNRIYNSGSEGELIDSSQDVWVYEADLDTIPGFRREVLNRGGQRKVYAALRMKGGPEAGAISVTAVESVYVSYFVFGGEFLYGVDLGSTSYSPSGTKWLQDTLGIYGRGNSSHLGKILNKDGDYYAIKGTRYNMQMGSAPDIRVFRSPKLFVQGITTEIINDNTLKWMPQVNEKDRSEFFANTAVLGQHSYKHPAAFDTATTRWRPIAQGPVTRDAPYGDTHGSGWPTDWYQRWSWVPFDSDASGASITNKITELGVVLDNDVTELRVDGTALGVDFFSGLGDTGLDPFEGELINPSEESRFLSGDSSYNNISVRIPITVSIEECDDGWSIPTLHMQKTFMVEIQMIQPGFSGARPLQNALWRSFSDDWAFINSDYDVYPVTPPNFDLGLTHFFSRTTANTEHDSEWSVPDFRFLTPFSLRFNTEDAGNQGTNIPTGVPLRIEFRLGTDADPDAEWLKDGAPTPQSPLGGLEPEVIERLSAFFTSIVVSARAQEEPTNE